MSDEGRTLKDDDAKNLNARIALAIVNDLEEEWPYLSYPGESWDSDKARHIIEMRLPLTIAEAQAQMDAIMNYEPPISRKGPSLISQLRKALGLDGDASLRTTLTLAIKRVGSEVQETTDE